jgi:hypothetical protein
MARSGGKGKKKSSGTAAGPVPSAAAQPTVATTVWRFGAIALGAVVAFVLLAGWNLFVPLLTVPLLVGGYVGLSVRRWVPAGAVGAGVGLVGGLIASAVYGLEAASALVQKLPEWFNRDIPFSFYQNTFAPILQSLHWSDGMGVVWILGACVLCGGFAAGVSWAMSRREDTKMLRKLVSWGLVAVLCLCFLVTAEQTSGALRTNVSVEPADYSYKFDAYIYVKTFYLMKQGVDYYPAVVQAASKDGRPNEGQWVKNGKLTRDLWPTPEYVRLPFTFQMWSAMGPTADWVVRWSEVLSALALAALFAGFWKRLKERALLIPFAMYPLMLAQGATVNVFFPDWWAVLAIVFAIALLAAELPEAAAIVTLFGTIFRFLALPMLAVIEFTALVMLSRKTERRRMAILAGITFACFAVFAVMWQQHTATALQFIESGTTSGSLFSGLVSGFATRDVATRLLAPSAYYMYAYGFGLFAPVLLFPTGFAGFLIAMRRGRFAQVALSLYVAGWFLFLAVVGPSSMYWGQLYTMALVIGTAALLATLDTAPKVLADAWRSVRAWTTARMARPSRAAA